MKLTHALSAVALAAAFTAAHAADPVVTIGGIDVAGQGQMTAVAGATTIDFNAPFVMPAGISCSGCEGALFNGSTTNVSAAPPADASQYLSVRPGTGAVTFTLATGADYIGFYGASLDSYNSMTLSLSNPTSTVTYTGTQLASFAGISANGDQGKGNYFNLFLTAPTHFTSVTLQSTSNAFEIDNLAVRTISAVPEPATTAMFAAGLAVLGLVARRRKA